MKRSTASPGRANSLVLIVKEQLSWTPQCSKSFLRSKLELHKGYSWKTQTVVHRPRVPEVASQKMFSDNSWFFYLPLSLLKRKRVNKIMLISRNYELHWTLLGESGCQGLGISAVAKTSRCRWWGLMIHGVWRQRSRTAGWCGCSVCPV